jgi:serine O-acetyltransferase
VYLDILRITGLYPATHRKIANVILNPCIWAIACYRLGHWLWRSDVPLLPRLLALAGRMVSGIEIAPSASIGPGLLIVHGTGVTIEAGAKIGPNATIYQGVGIGQRFSPSSPEGVPTIGRNVEVYAGAKVLGPITIGDNCRIGANAVVLRSFLEDSTRVGVPAYSVGRCEPRSDTAAEGTVAIVDNLRQAEPSFAGGIWTDE